MNEKNLEYLQNQVLYTGFGIGLDDELKEKINEAKPEFQLTHSSEYGKDKLSTILNFSRSKESDMYFFNSYQVNMQKDNAPERLEQTIYINKGSNITLKEAYNLMNGRSVNKNLTNKDGQVYNAWIQLDFKQTDAHGNFKIKPYHENYGYNLEEALAKHPIKELNNDEFKKGLMDSLKKGNLQSATFRKGTEEVQHYIEANPQFKNINIYDTNMQRLDRRQSKSEKQTQTEDKSVKQDAKRQKNTPTEDGDFDAPKEAPKKRRRQSQSM